MNQEEDRAEGRQWTYEDFVAVHEGQLLAATIPQRHWSSIFFKLVNEVFFSFFRIYKSKNSLNQLTSKIANISKISKILMIPFVGG
jgi:hypothetical protein